MRKYLKSAWRLNEHFAESKSASAETGVPFNAKCLRQTGAILLLEWNHTTKNYGMSIIRR